MYSHPPFLAQFCFIIVTIYSIELTQYGTNNHSSNPQSFIFAKHANFIQCSLWHETNW